MRWCALVYNPMKIKDLEKIKQVVLEKFQAAGWQDPVWYETEKEDAGYRIAKQVVKQKPDLICVIGGDGTVRTVCAATRNSSIPVGILPAGTGNLLARNLAIKLDLSNALDTAINGENKAIDLAKVSTENGEYHHFVVMSGVGLDADMLENTDTWLKAKIGWLAYVFGIVRGLISPSFKARVYADGKLQFIQRSKMVIVCNCSSLVNNLTVAPNALINDGRLDVVLVKLSGPYGWISAFRNTIYHPQRPHRLLWHSSGRKIKIVLNRPVSAEIDGDLIGQCRTLYFSVKQRCVLVKVPKN